SGQQERGASAQFEPARGDHVKPLSVSSKSLSVTGPAQGPPRYGKSDDVRRGTMPAYLLATPGRKCLPGTAGTASAAPAGLLRRAGQPYPDGAELAGGGPPHPPPRGGARQEPGPPPPGA